MITIVSLLCSQGVLRFVDAFANLPLWVDCTIAGVVTCVVSVALYRWRDKR